MPLVQQLQIATGGESRAVWNADSVHLFGELRCLLFSFDPGGVAKGLMSSLEGFTGIAFARASKSHIEGDRLLC